MKKNTDFHNFSLKEKRTRLKNILLEKLKGKNSVAAVKINSSANQKNIGYDAFSSGIDYNHEEIGQFNKWLDSLKRNDFYVFAAEHLSAPEEETEIILQSGKKSKVLNFSSYNYLGYGCHPKVKLSAKEAIEKFGIGAGSSPIFSGNFTIHREFEKRLIKFLGLSKDYGISIFSTGYGANTGTISAYMKPGSYVVLDEFSHISLIEGAFLSGAIVRIFKHNDMNDLENILISINERDVRKLICCEGVYSAGGDRGNIKSIVALAKKYNARTLVDEAHSIMIAGEQGRGVSAEQGVLKEIDMLIVTFSKAFCSLGGALVAKKGIAQYVNWYAKCRMFSAAIPPAVIGGISKVLELGSSADGDKRRKRIIENSAYMRSLLKGKVDILDTSTWIVPVLCYDEKVALRVGGYLQKNGVDVSLMCFPAVPHNKARIRLFITSEHTKSQIKKASAIILDAAKKYKIEQ